MAPYFSICIPAYNGEKFIERAVDSVLGQTFDDWSLTIIDDQSKDGTWELLQRRYAGHPRIRLLRNEKNLRLYANLNRCIEESNGEWVAFLAQDDYYALHALQVIHDETVRDPETILWIHSQFTHGEGIPPHACVVHSHRTEFRAQDLAKTLYLKGNLYGVLSNYLVRSSAFKKQNLRFFDGLIDVPFWIRVLRANPDGKAIYWPDMLAHVLLHEQSGSSVDGRSGRFYKIFFDDAGSLADQGWSKWVLLMQMARIIKCWGKFASRLPKDAKQAPVQALKRLSAALLRGENSVAPG
jgi:glycosyltransferase involved in cell wall biosynthesis